MHFWCDSYGLYNFFEHFDVFGASAPTASSITWQLRSDGLYRNHQLVTPWWGWQNT